MARSRKGRALIRRPRPGHPIFAITITDSRPDALPTDVLLHKEGGEKLWVRSAGLSTDEAVERASHLVEEKLGGEWVMEDWRAG